MHGEAIAIVNLNSTPFDVAEYDEQIKRTLPFYEEMYQQIVDVVKALGMPAFRWLDVGCGTGKMARIVRSHFDLKKMVCVDVNGEMVQRAKKSFDDERLEFLQCDVRELPYQEMFDIVTAVQVNHYFQRQERMAVARKCFAALKEDGIYLSFENFAPESSEGKMLYFERWKQFQIAHGKSEEEAVSHIRRYGQDYFPMTIGESVRLLKDCGFSMVEIFWVSYMQVGILARK